MIIQFDENLIVRLKQLNSDVKERNKLYHPSSRSFPLLGSTIRSQVIIECLYTNDPDNVPHAVSALLGNTSLDGDSYTLGFETMTDVSRNGSPTHLLSYLEVLQDVLNSIENTSAIAIMNFLSDVISNSFSKLIFEQDKMLLQMICARAHSILLWLNIDYQNNPATSDSAIILHGALFSILYGLQGYHTGQTNDWINSMYKWSKALRLALDQRSVGTEMTSCYYESTDDNRILLPGLPQQIP